MQYISIRRRRRERSTCLRSIVASLALASLAWGGSSTIAADRYWSGTGTWSTGTSNWGTSSGGPYNTGTWSNSPADAAIFEGTAGTVSLGSAITAAGLTFNVAGYTVTGGTLTLSGSTVTTSVDATIASRISGTVGLRKTGAGTLMLSGPRDFSNPVTIDSGTLKVTSSGLLGTGTTAINAGTLEISGTALNFIGATSRAITVAAGATLLAANTTAATNGHNLGSLTLNGGTLASNAVTSGNNGNFILRAVTVGGLVRSTIQSTDIGIATGTQTWTINNAADGTDLLVTSRIVAAGGGVIRKEGLGTLELTGSNSNNAGTIIAAGSVIAGHARALGTGTASFTGAATLQMGVSGTIANAFSIGSGVTATFDTAGQNTTLSGTVSGVGSFTKSGAGVLTLSNPQLFSGAARITAGTLAIGGSNTLAAASRIDVGPSAVLSATTAGLAVVNAQTLGGYGTIDGGVTFLGGSVLSPGGSVGQLSQTGAAVFSGSASYLFEVTNPTGVPGTGWDLFTVDSLSITASSSSPYLVSLTSLTTGTSSTPGPMTGWNPDTSYAWLLVDTNSSITGFDPAAFTIDTTNFTPYNDVNGMFSIARGNTVEGGDATQLYVVYAVVPEPAGLALAGIGLGAAGWLARRRRTH